MPGFLSFLSSPLKDVLGEVGKIIDNVTTSGEEKLAAKQKLVEVERNFQVKMVELDQQWAATQASVITAEAGSASWLARNWRPILMLVFTYIVAHNYVIAPIFGVQATAIPPDMWELLRIGMGGYIVGRSVEKIAPHVADVVKAAKAAK